MTILQAIFPRFLIYAWWNFGPGLVPIKIYSPSQTQVNSTISFISQWILMILSSELDY
jgi:hypothetical protein